MLVLIRPIKASFIVLLNPILNHLPTADYQQNSFYDPSVPLIYMVIAEAILDDHTLCVGSMILATGYVHLKQFGELSMVRRSLKNIS